MDKKFIDEEEVFAINPDYSTFLHDFDGVKVLVVDDFYKNPYLVRQLALDIPASSNKRIRANNPALRVNAFYELSSMAWIYDQLARQYFPEIMEHYPIDYMQRSFENATFMVNVMQTENLPPICPHMDNNSGINLASTIYLNTPNECNGGTSFYKFGGKTYYEDPSIKHTLDIAGKMHVSEYITDSIVDWELLGIAHMKFNRMVLYNQAVLHTAYVKPHMFRDKLYRINQQFFI